MGIYVFTWSKLRKYLIEDEANPNSSNDFGSDVLPAMLKAGERMMAYEFSGYWKDVGTIDSLWESNMDLLNPKMELDISTRIPGRFIPEIRFCLLITSAKMPRWQDFLITEGCNVYGEIDFTVLFDGVNIGSGAVVRDSIVMPGATIEDGAVVQYAIIGENVVIGKNAVIGARPEDMENVEGMGSYRHRRRLQHPFWCCHRTQRND